jgi:hypothetical protein
MKARKFIFGASVIILFSTLLCSFRYVNSRSEKSLDIKPTPGFPEEIMKIVINSCYDCHTGEARSPIAKSILDFSKWNDYKTAKKVQLLSKMDEVISDKSMPPKKYLDQNPGKSLTQDQIDLLSKWTKEESNRLLGGS